MKKKEYEMPDGYKKNLERLAGFLATRESYRKEFSDTNILGVRISAADKAMMDAKLREFDVMIDELEKRLAEEYERYQAEMAREEELTESIAKADDLAKHLYIIIKHQSPHLLESFSQCLDPLTPAEREHFLDQVAILEATQLDAILNGNTT